MGRSDFAMHPGNLVVSVPTPQNKFSLQVFLPINQFLFSYIHKPSCPFPSKVRFWWTKIKPLYIFMCPKRCSLYFQPILPGQMHGLSHSKSSKLTGCMWANAHLIWETLFKYFTHELSARRGWVLSYVRIILLNYCQQYLWDCFYHLFPPSYLHTFLSNLLVFSNLTALHIVPVHDIISKVNLQVKENLTNIILFDQKTKWYMTFFYPNYSKYLIMLGIFSSSREMHHVFPWIYQ